MPGLLVNASSSSSTADNSEWAFNLRDSSRFYRDAYASSDSDSESAQAAAANKPASHAQLLKDLDLSTRGDTAVYVDNPWSIAKQNAACRATSSSSAFVSVAKPQAGAHANPPPARENIPRKPTQMTLDKAFTVEKSNFAKPVPSGNGKLSSPRAHSNSPADVMKLCAFQTDASSANSAVYTIPNQRDFSAQHPSAYEHSIPRSASVRLGIHDILSDPYKAANPVHSIQINPEPKKYSDFSNPPSDTTNLLSSRTSSSSSKHSSTQFSIKPSLETYFNPNRKRKRTQTHTYSDDDPESDSNWTTLPSKVKKRFKPDRSRQPNLNPAVKSSGKFRLPIPIRVQSSETESKAVVAKTVVSTEKLSGGRSLTLYKPPAREVTQGEEQPVILRVRKGGKLDLVGVASASAGRLKEVEVKEDTQEPDSNEVNARIQSSTSTPCSSPPPFLLSPSPVLSYSITELERGYAETRKSLISRKRAFDVFFAALNLESCGVVYRDRDSGDAAASSSSSSSGSSEIEIAILSMSE